MDTSDPAGIYYCRGLRSAAYGGYSLLGGDVSDFFLAWSESASDEDEAPPRWVRTTLLQTISACGSFAYLGPRRGPTTGDERSGGRRCTAGPGLLGGWPRRKLYWQVAEAPEQAPHLFDDPGHPWHLSGQVILLLGASPSFSDPRLWSLAHRQIRLDRSLLTDLGLTGLVLPGSDGELVQAVLADVSTQARCIAGLNAACEAAGRPCREVSEPEFGLAGTPSQGATD